MVLKVHLYHEVCTAWPLCVCWSIYTCISKCARATSWKACSTDNSHVLHTCIMKCAAATWLMVIGRCTPSVLHFFKLVCTVHQVVCYQGFILSTNKMALWTISSFVQFLIMPSSGVPGASKFNVGSSKQYPIHLIFLLAFTPLIELCNCLSSCEFSLKLPIPESSGLHPVDTVIYVE